MMEISLCTYGVSRGGHKPVGKRLLCKHEMHCQHSRKALTPKQIQKSAAAKAKKLRKPLCTLVRDKKTVSIYSHSITASSHKETEKSSWATSLLVEPQSCIRAGFHPQPSYSCCSSSQLLPYQWKHKAAILWVFCQLKAIVPHLRGTYMNKCSFSTQKQMSTNKQCWQTVQLIQTCKRYVVCSLNREKETMGKRMENTCLKGYRM